MDEYLFILMIGLMTHVGDERVSVITKEGVGIIADRQNTDHKPVLFAYGESNSGFLYEIQQGDVITFPQGPTTPGAATTTDNFRTYTPSITEPLTNSFVDEPVRSLQRHDGVVAWLEYPEGTLDVAGFQPDEARFFRGNDFVRKQCVPFGTGFFARTSGDIVMRIEHGGSQHTSQYVSLGSWAEVYLLNQPHDSMRPSDAMASRHFANYGGLLERRYGIMPRHIATVAAGDPCELTGTLGRNTTVQNLADASLARFVTTEEIAKQMRVRRAENVSPVLRILVSEHPACTNTDWP